MLRAKEMNMGFFGDSTDEDTFSSWTASSPELSQFDEALLDPFRPGFLCALLQEFERWHTYKKTNITDDADGRSGRAQNRQRQTNSGRQQSHPVNRGGRFKKNSSGGDGDGTGENDGSGSPEHSREARLLACPFYKWNPLTHQDCRQKILETITRMKQHLHRCHEVPIHCYVCYEEFSSTDDCSIHVRLLSCTKKPEKQWKGRMTESQKRAIKRRTDTRKSKDEQWYDVFKILFPGHPLPKNPFLEQALSDDLLYKSSWPKNRLRSWTGSRGSVCPKTFGTKRIL
jgi:hypothetical protein